MARPRTPGKDKEQPPGEPTWTHPQTTPVPGPSTDPVRKAVRRAKIIAEPDPAAEKERERLRGEIDKKLPPPSPRKGKGA
jgi:hypothetical protein